MHVAFDATNLSGARRRWRRPYRHPRVFPVDGEADAVLVAVNSAARMGQLIIKAGDTEGADRLRKGLYANRCARFRPDLILDLLIVLLR